MQRWKKMFNIFKEENCPKSEDEKLEILFRKIQCSQLATNVASLQAQYDLSENGITYDQAINHLASIVINTMSNRFVNQVQVNPNIKPGNGHQGARGIYNGRNNFRGGCGGRGRNSQRSKTWIPYHKWSKMTTKKRWEAKNQNKAKGNSQPKIQQVSYNKVSTGSKLNALILEVCC